MIFGNIEYLFLLVLLIPYIIWYVMKRKKTEPTEITIEEKRSKQGRMELLGSLIAIGIALLVILFLVSKGIYNLI